MQKSENKSPAVNTEELPPVLDSSSLKNLHTTDKAGFTEQSPEVEIGGRKGLEPTRFGDWEKNGRCTDF